MEFLQLPFTRVCGLGLRRTPGVSQTGIADDGAETVGEWRWLWVAPPWPEPICYRKIKIVFHRDTCQPRGAMPPIWPVNGIYRKA